jgi:diguanylate cyclase (GGDEF)-like protein
MAWTEGRRGGSRAVLGIHVACAVVAVLLVASLAFVLDRAVFEADRFGLSSERKLVASDLQHQTDAVVQYQAELSFWDKTYAQIETGRFSQAFVTEEVIEWLWADFGFSWMIFTGRAGPPILAVHDGREVSPETGAATLKWVADLLTKANGNYEAALRPDGSGWRIAASAKDRDGLTVPVPNIHAADLRMINGRMSIVVVQAVIPQSLEIDASRREPVFMVTVKPFTERMLVNMQTRLSVGNLTFQPLNTVSDGSIHTPLNDCGRSDCMVAAWTPRAPGSFVRSETLPSVLAIATAGALLMVFIAARFGRVFAALQKSEAENGYMAKHDRLTGLLNRSGFDETLNAAVRSVAKQPFALLCIDLDKFKAVNDAHGHPAGDAVLKTIASRFAARIGDMAAVARLGGDEFAVVIPLRDRQDIVSLANALIVDTQVPIPFEGQLLRVGSSIGVAFAPEHGETPRDLVPQADRALYLAKNRGRNRVQTADDLSDDVDVVNAGQAA